MHREGNEIRIPWKYRLISLLIANAAADGVLASVFLSNSPPVPLREIGLSVATFGAVVLLIGVIFWLPIMLMVGRAMPPVWVFTLCGALAGFLTPSIFFMGLDFMQGNFSSSALMGSLMLGLFFPFTVLPGAAGGAFCGFYLEYVRNRMVRQIASLADPENF